MRLPLSCVVSIFTRFASLPFQCKKNARGDRTYSGDPSGVLNHIRMTLSYLLLEQEAHNGRTKLLQWEEPSTKSDGDYGLITGELTAVGDI
jgi:hypothetical protein